MPATDNPIAALVEAVEKLLPDWYWDTPSGERITEALAAVEALKPVGWRCERGHLTYVEEDDCRYLLPDDEYCLAPLRGLTELP